MTEFEIELARFCKDLQAALASKDKPEWLKPDYGLCENLYSWAGGYGAHTSEAIALQDMLQELFVDEYGSLRYPFELGKTTEDRRYSYVHAVNTGAVYSNPRRLAFINQWAALAP